MKGKHAQKKFGAIGTMAPTPLSLKTLGGGGGWGVSHTRTGPGRPPMARRPQGRHTMIAGCLVALSIHKKRSIGRHCTLYQSKRLGHLP